jgi:hypothetical protein
MTISMPPPVLSIPTSTLTGCSHFQEADSMQSGYMDDINFILACLEGCFPDNSRTLHHHNTEYQSQGDPVSTFPPV